MAMLIFEWLSPRRRREAATRQLWANLFAIRLFGDEPSIVLESLLGVIRANARLLLCAIPPILILAPGFYFLFGYLEARYGVAPLQAGVPRVVTVKLSQMDDPELETPDWITVDAPPVHILQDREISWRILPKRSGEALLQVNNHGELLPVNALQNMFEPAPPMQLYGVSLKWTWWLAIGCVVSVFPARLIAALHIRRQWFFINPVNSGHSFELAGAKLAIQALHIALFTHGDWGIDIDFHERCKVLFELVPQVAKRADGRNHGDCSVAG